MLAQTLKSQRGQVFLIYIFEFLRQASVFIHRNRETFTDPYRFLYRIVRMFICYVFYPERERWFLKFSDLTFLL